MRNRRHRPRRNATVELNITAFMNLMVVLVPFLLMTAVFTHLSILELNLPKPGSGGSKNKKPTFELQVIIRKDALLLADNKGGLIKRVPMSRTGKQYGQLNTVLKQVKARFPGKTNISILSEPRSEEHTSELQSH